MELRRPEVGSRARLGSSGGESAGKPPPGPKSQPRWGRQNGRLRTGVRCAIIDIIAQLNQLRNGVYSGRLRGLETGHSWMR